MTANHEHTPTWDRVRAHYYLGRQQFNDPLFPDGGVTEIVAEFDRWYQAEIAAAEQRGAVKALRDAAKVLHDDVDIIIKGNYAVYFREDEADSKGVFPWKWLKNRADQIANKEGQ